MGSQMETRLLEIRTTQEEAVKAKLVTIVESACSLVERMKASGKTDKECSDAVKKLRYGENDKGYLWIQTHPKNDLSKATTVMHAANPKLDGASLDNFIDTERFKTVRINGKTLSVEEANIPSTRLFIEMNKICAKQGEGVVRYYWQKPKAGGGSTDEGYLKMSYVKRIPSQNWIIGCGEYVDDIDEIVAKEAIKAEAESDSLTRSMITILVLVGLVIAGITFYISHTIAVSVKEMSDATHLLSEGDTSASITYQGKDEIGEMADAMRNMVTSQKTRTNLALAISNGDLKNDVTLASERDELGRALDSMTKGLRKLISEIRTGAAQIDSGSNQVSNSSQALSQGATESAASVEEITSSVTELSSRTNTNAENAREANKLASNAHKSAETGVERMASMIGAMDKITSSSDEISKIIKVIDDIAFQTNLLALNAAVEAARAGRHGKGFAVVAEEVRSLAARSAKAAKETSELIKESSGRVENGASLAHATEEALQEIVDATIKVTSLVGDITADSDTQAKGLKEVNDGLLLIDNVTQQNAAYSEETASTSEELSSQATVMRKLVERFEL